MVTIRLCVGCGVRVSRQKLIRVVRRDDQVILDEEASLPGRGAWLHPDQICIEQAIARGVFPRALRVPEKLGTAELENRLEKMMDHS